MLYTGSIILAQDIEAVIEYARVGYKVITVTEDNLDQITYMIGGPTIKATILLPPCDAMQLLMDGQYDAFNSLYLSYLSTNFECLNYQDILVLSALKGINMVLYIPRDELELGFYDTLNFYMLNYRGILIGNAMQNVPFNFSQVPAFDIYNLERLYIGEFITAGEYITYYPINEPVNPQTIVQLFVELYGSVIANSFDINKMTQMIERMIITSKVENKFRMEGFVVC